MALEAFKSSQPLTLGVELELQVLDPTDYNLAPCAPDLIYWVGKQSAHSDRIVPEITQSMIEINTGVHSQHASLLEELRALRDHLHKGAGVLNVRLCGGGTHPFQDWPERRITDSPRHHKLSELYGYLAKQFTVFGQHIHVGCANGDDAMYLLHALGRYVPHFIALSASSPFVQGHDTLFQSARLNAIAAFPLSGRAPLVLTWREFEAYYEKMTATGVVASMKDFYWDIRPKPNYGTIEIRVCDTPLHVSHAADLAAYAQALCHYLLEQRPIEPIDDDYLVYSFNRFQACRFGLEGTMVDPRSRRHRRIADDIVETLTTLRPHAEAVAAESAHQALLRRAARGESDAEHCRTAFSEFRSPQELARWQARQWLV